MPDIARDELLRTKPFTLTRAAEGGDTDGLTLEGHAAVFNETTLIDSWEGRFLERVAPGAFKKTLRERTPVLQFDHGHHPLVGSIPIGRIQDAHEDDTGVFVQARLHDNWLVQPVRDAIVEGSITGMSFRFSPVREEWRGEDGRLVKDDEEILALLWSGTEMLTRTLKELKVPELGPVVFPAYQATDVGVRSGRTTIDLGSLRSDPNARKNLARALWLAEVPSSDDAPPDGHLSPRDRTDAPPVDGHPSQLDTPEPQDRAAALAARMQDRLTYIHERSK